MISLSIFLSVFNLDELHLIRRQDKVTLFNHAAYGNVALYLVELKGDDH